MAPIGGKKKQQNDGFTKYVGFFRGEVVSINPDRQQLNKLFGKEDGEDDKDIEYTGEKEGVRWSRITFWLSVEGHDGVFIPHSITLKDEVRRDKTKSKIQLINQVGASQWVEADEDNEYDKKVLFDSFKAFTKVTQWKLANGELSKKWEKGAKPAEGHVDELGPKQYRPALIGEEELAEFMKNWLNIDFNEVSANILMDTRKFFGGNFKDLQNIDRDLQTPFVALAYVRTDDNDPDKQYQKIFKKFLPNNFMKFINNNLNFPNKFTSDRWASFMKEVEGEYGPDGQYVLEPLKEYDPHDDFTTSKSTKADAPAVQDKKSSKY